MKNKKILYSVIGILVAIALFAGGFVAGRATSHGGFARGMRGPGMQGGYQGQYRGQPGNASSTQNTQGGQGTQTTQNGGVGATVSGSGVVGQ